MAQSSLQIESGFAREVNQYRWTSVADWQAGLASWDLGVSNRFVSDAFNQFDDRLRFRDENRLRVTGTRPIARSLEASVRGDLDWYGSSRAFTQALYGGVRYRPHASLTLEPLVGVASDRRPGVPQADGSLPQRFDAGPAAGGLLQMTQHNVAGYVLELEAEGIWQRLTPRRARHLNISGRAERLFGAARLSSNLRVASRRRDTYQAASFLNRAQALSPESIEATTSDTLDAGLQVMAPIIQDLRLLVQADVRANNRRIRTPRFPEESLYFETDFNRRAFGGEVGLIFDRGTTTAHLIAELSATTEERRLSNREDLPTSEAARKIVLLQQADYDEGVVGVQASLRTLILRLVTLHFSGSSRIVRHDTPIVNLDDRDEVYHNGQLGLSVLASRYLQADVRLFGSYYHAVYLNGERSAENSVQRSLRLRPSLDWRPGSGTRVQLASEIRATYTVDDFLLPGRKPKDQSAREMRLEGDWEQHLTRDTGFRLTSSYSDMRLGRLLWDAFAEIPFDTLRTYSTWARVQTGRRLRAEIGWRIFLRSDYDRAALVRYPRTDTDGRPLHDASGRELTNSIVRPGRRWIAQSGPAASVYWTRGLTMLRLDAWANGQRVYYNLYGMLPATSRVRILEAARHGTRRLIPLVSMSVRWQPR